MSLRDIVCSVLEDGLDRLGVTYEFPSTDARHENKSAFEEMMAAFQAVHRDRGLLLVLDELLDYLRSRTDQALKFGPLVPSGAWRGLQRVKVPVHCRRPREPFRQPRFQFVTDTLRRVKDRFEQVRIARDDVAFVVAERLLKKDAKQQALIQEHLWAVRSSLQLNERADGRVCPPLSDSPCIYRCVPARVCRREA